GKKITYGCKIAKEDGCDYIMSVDADDLISNQLLNYIEANNNNGKVPGWYIEKGYVVSEGGNWAIRQKKMHLFNGSTHILRSDIINIPDFNSTEWHDFSLFTAHGWIKGRLKKYFNIEIEPIGFYAVVYIIHHNN